LTAHVLFVCIHTSARSQMAEAFLNHHCAQRFTAASAGIEPGKLNPIVVAAMRERGIDISRHGTRSVEQMRRSGVAYEYVITVCDETSAERCPVFPGRTKRLHWGFPDPSALVGTPDDKLAGTRVIRDQIERRVAAWCAEMCRA
jgi:arsenate reductase